MSAAPHDFAPFVATLGRGPGRSRALTRAEARQAMRMVLRGEAEPAQIGAFLMLLRYRGEDADEIAGLVEAAREAASPGPTGPSPFDVDLDWPSYGAGRTRAAPWFLLAALAVARSGIRVLMHGCNEFAGGLGVADALTRLGLAAAGDPATAKRQLDATNFAYLPLQNFAPSLADLLGLRRLLGLRSPVNTVARLLDPGDARAGVDGVFHPPYIETHLAAAERLDRPRLLVLKGGGGEAERNPAKPSAIHLWTRQQGRSTQTLPPLTTATEPANPPDIAAIWHGTTHDPAIEARIIATITLALTALDAGTDTEASLLWQRRGK